MKNKFVNFADARKIVFGFALIFGVSQIFGGEVFAQQKPRKKIASPAKQKPAPKSVSGESKKDAPLASAPKVTRIDALALKKLVKRGAANSKPLVVNFWATWCPPCLDEFPELVKINDEYKNKLDFALVSLDDLAEIARDVPQFLIDTKAVSIPAYLLKTQNEQAAIASIAKNYAGGLPFTVLFDASGAVVYSRRGRIDAAVLRGEIEKVLARETIKPIGSK